MEPGRRLLAGRYRLESLIARGGMGQVWRAHDGLLDRHVAVKVLRAEYSGDETFLARFRAEAHHAALVSHPGIAALHDYGELPPDEAGEQLAFLVMELVDGEALSELLAREGRLDAARTLALLRSTAEALAAAHAAGLVHRDVKPGNVLVARDGGVKITDFGIAWSASSAPLTRTGQVVGTAHYLAPEQAAGHRAGPASDVYALGLIGYECLAGQRAFDGENSVQIALMQLRQAPPPLPDDVPAPVRALVERALTKDPAGRFADGAAFLAAIDDVLAGRPLAPAPPAGTAPLPLGGRTAARRSTRVLAPVAALLVGAGLALAGLQLTSAGAEGAPVDLPVQAAEDDAATAVVLVAEDWLGRPVGEVEAELGALGLQVTREPETTSAAEPGAVTAIGPTGAVLPGAVVTVRYAVAPDAPAAEAPVPGGAAQVGAGVPAPAAPAPAAPAPAVPAPAGAGQQATPADPPGRGQPGVPGNGAARGKNPGNGRS